MIETCAAGCFSYGRVTPSTDIRELQICRFSGSKDTSVRLNQKHVQFGLTQNKYRITDQFSVFTFSYSFYMIRPNSLCIFFGI